VITSEPNMIDDVSVLGNFGSSDHNMLEWNVNYDPKVHYSERSCPDYSRANFAAIRQALEAVDWSQVLQGDANDKWASFASIIRDLESKYIPRKKNTQFQEESTMDDT